MSQFLRTRIGVACPVCGRSLSPTLEDVRQERTIWCPGGHDVKLVDQNDGVRRADRQIERQLDDFTRKMRRLGFTVRRRR